MGLNMYTPIDRGSHYHSLNSKSIIIHQHANGVPFFFSFQYTMPWATWLVYKSNLTFEEREKFYDEVLNACSSEQRPVYLSVIILSTHTSTSILWRCSAVFFEIIFQLCSFLKLSCWVETHPFFEDAVFSRLCFSTMLILKTKQVP
jgi:hypothetical protein